MIPWHKGSKHLLDKADSILLDRFVTLLNEYPDQNLEVVAYAPVNGKQHADLKLAKRFANTVKACVMNKGIGEKRIKASWKASGKTDASTTRKSSTGTKVVLRLSDAGK